MSYVKRLRKILQQAGSPLAPYAGYIARMEEKYGLPRGLIVGIAKAESSFGTAGDPVKYHNAWGWTSGGPPNWRRFPNWKIAIREYAKFLSENYVGQGLDTPEKMMRRYVGYDAPQWVRNVNSVLQAVSGGYAPEVRNPSSNQTPQHFDSWDLVNNRDSREVVLNALFENIRARSQGMEPPNSLARTIIGLRLQGLDGGTFDNPNAPGIRASSKAVNAAIVGSGLAYSSAGPVHETEGLKGYPALDFMASGGTPVFAPASGVIPKDKPFGKNPTQNPAAGFGGSRLYFRANLDNDPEPEELFITHLERLAVKPGQKVKKGQLLGYVWHWPGDPGRAHAHIGIRGADPTILFKLFPKKPKKHKKKV